MLGTTSRSRSVLALTTAATLLVFGASCRAPAEASGPDAQPRATADDRQDTSIPTTPAHIRGTITRVQPGADTPPTGGDAPPGGTVSCPPDCGGSGTRVQALLVEEKPGMQEGDKSYVTVLRGARLLRRTTDGVVPMPFSELKAGQIAEVWFDGAVAMSYPSQGKASVLVVDGR